MATFTGADKAIGFLFDIARNVADDYDSSSTYAQGSYAIYEGTLYKCINPISTPEDFTPAHWQAVLIMDEVAAGGGGGGGTTVIANPAGTATDTLNKLQVGATIYDVPSGGGSSGHTYSLTEQIVGTWIDGRTIYEITYDLGSDISISNTGWTTLSVQVSNFGGVISGMALTERFGTSTPVMVTFNASNYLQLQSVRNSYTSTCRYLVLQYFHAT